MVCYRYRMKSNATASTPPSETKRQSHGPTFAKVVDGRKHPIRGLGQRNERYYAQLTVFDPVTGKNKVQRICLVDKEGEPVKSRADAVAGMESLRTKRRDTGLEAQRRRAPRF